MIHSSVLITKLKNNELNQRLVKIYQGNEKMIHYQKIRYINALKKYEKFFGEDDVDIYSAPGRTEIGGNYTDQQHGTMLSATVNLDIIAIVGKNTENAIKIISEGYIPLNIDLNNIHIDKKEYGTTAALIKGIVAGMKEQGYQVGPFKAYMTSDIPKGIGFASSAAFETIIGTIIAGQYNNMAVSPIDIALIGQYAENVYYGKIGGITDQLACSIGGFVHIDFKDALSPIVRKIDYNIADENYSLCIVNTRSPRTELTGDYDMIMAEMKTVANLFGKQFLRDIPKEEFYKKIPEIIDKTGDRCILRAIHFFEENDRVDREVTALKEKRFEDFLNLVKKSGDSSYKYLQNVYSNHDEQKQPLSLALALSEKVLGENGVSRVHGIGFAGMILSFVNNSSVKQYKSVLEQVFGKNSCHILKVRKYGGIRIL